MGHIDQTAEAALRSVSLGDRYDLAADIAYMNGAQALTRLLMNQRERDRRASLNTAGFVSGYRGSPMAGFDQTLWSAARQLAEYDVKFQPAINEDLGVTACWGAQQLVLFPDEATVDGVFSLWYGKGPGVDRSGDALKHANAAGSSPLGGVLVLAADDHASKSSTFPHQSEQALVAAFIPVLYPASVQEYLDFGVHGWAMSRYSGLWIGMKCVADVVETTAVADVRADRVEVQLPPPLTSDAVHIRWPDVWVDQEQRMIRKKLPAALDYCRVNCLNRIEFKKETSTLGIVSAGKAYNDVRQALGLLGLDDSSAASHGLAILKIGMVWPLEPNIVREFAEGLSELLVIEEKRPVIEQQIKDELYADAVSGQCLVRISGKSDGRTGGEWGSESARTLLRSDYELTPLEIARAIVQRLEEHLANDPRLPLLQQRLVKADLVIPASVSVARRPYFCSGCPHNTSTVVPEGSRATAGIGCHYMANWMDRSTVTYTHMGAEGVPWMAQSLFSKRRHIFVNLGDGTYYHSGSLAIRQAVAARLCVTYKILFNDAVAMTGGQPVEGQLTVDQITQQMASEGVGRIAVVSDDIEKYAASTYAFAPSATFHHRRDLDSVQRELSGYEGVSALIYDQTCASEKRRRRKRGTYADPAQRVIINPDVCEGCGDCSIKSNCLSVEPLETPLGRKRQINQSSCNKDFSCVEGFCPSFVTVKGGKLRRGVQGLSVSILDGSELPPEPAAPALDRPFAILVNGVGGTGVVTIGGLLGMAAHLSGKGCSVLDMAGLAQKGGAVWSHVQLAPTQLDLHASRIVSGAADVMIGCDLIVSGQADSRAKLRAGHSRAVINTDVAPTSEFVSNGDWQVPVQELKDGIIEACGSDNVAWIAAQGIALRHLGDAIYSNLVMLGYAWQRGWIPMSLKAIDRAIELNGQAVPDNKKAFLAGRWSAHDPKRLESTAERVSIVKFMPTKHVGFEKTLRHREGLLVQYQNHAYADRFSHFVSKVRSHTVAKGIPDEFATAVASSLYKLMTYKDEYEVARLHSDPEFLESIRAQFDGEVEISYTLAPPLFAKKDANGHLQKTAYGPWMGSAFRWLARLKFLRGTPLDPFGYTVERRTERSLVAEYQQAILSVLPHLQSHPADCLALAKVPELIRGYGHVKERAIAAARLRQSELLTRITGKPLQPIVQDGYATFFHFG